MITTNTPVSNLKSGNIKHETLTKLFTDRVKRYKILLSEVEPMSLEQALDCFRRDADPERELYVWENIALAYILEVQNRPECSIADKKKLFVEILRSTM